MNFLSELAQASNPLDFSTLISNYLNTSTSPAASTTSAINTPGLLYENDLKRIITEKWRISTVNSNYQLCPTYPQLIAVPTDVSDSVLRHAASFRSKQRIPALTFIHKPNNCSISRCAQPLVGLTQNRSIQDEKLIENIFNTAKTSQINYILDARPLANALAQTALGNS
jgi:hypothetical protein